MSSAPKIQTLYLICLNSPKIVQFLWGCDFVLHENENCNQIVDTIEN